MKLISSMLIMIGFIANTAQANPYGMVYTKQELAKMQKRPSSNDLDAILSNSRLDYHGGMVISNILAYSVMWGEGVDSRVQSGVGSLLTAMLNSTLFDMLSQYSTVGAKVVGGHASSQQVIGRGSYGGNVVIHPSNAASTVTDSQVGAEIEYQIRLGVLPAPNENTVYSMFFPPGISISLGSALSCQVFCGYHHKYNSSQYGEIHYTVLPNFDGLCAAGCGSATDSFATLSIVLSHEITEVVTDPSASGGSGPAFPDAWNTSGGQEIGDLCAQRYTSLKTSNFTYEIQEQFDNRTNSCDETIYTSP